MCERLISRTIGTIHLTLDGGWSPVAGSRLNYARQTVDRFRIAEPSALPIRETLYPR
jgi:hypothetical protein